MAILALLYFATTTAQAATTYYVSQSTGNDANDGFHAPWKTLTRASQITYTDGDQLLLKCGDTWTDGLELKGNGSAANPAVVSSYGTGRRPIIDRQDSSLAGLKKCVHLDGNAFGWKIMNLELANAFRGIQASVAQPGRSFLSLENLDVHGCKFGKRFDRDSGNQNNMQNGIRLDGSGRLDKATIVSCTFRDNFVGAWIGGCSDIKDCLFEHAEWTGLWYVSADGGRISGNKFIHNCDQFVWCGVSASALASVKNCVVENNEFAETQVVDGAFDGEDLDFEAGCQGVILRHNLFHDSGGPASMLYNSASHNSPNSGIAIIDNVFFNSARKPSAPNYNCTFLLSDGNSGSITNNRIYHHHDVPIFAGSPCPGVNRAGNIEHGVDDVPPGATQIRAAAVSASSNNADAAKVQDNDPTTVWTGASASDQWVQLDFKKSRTFEEFLVEQASGSCINNFVLQSWEGGGWKDIFTSCSALGPRKFMPVLPVSTSKVRLLIYSTASGAPAIAEFKAFDLKKSDR